MVDEMLIFQGIINIIATAVVPKLTEQLANWINRMMINSNCTNESLPYCLKTKQHEVSDWNREEAANEYGEIKTDKQIHQNNENSRG